eukprot:TRINITY_DN1611_c0_g1_i1.p1 TRINITY_DN1611_c0_g1~~TRINITY_DN1611_c0_g1_i1.p1  ORF type:complete len:361 (-),score=105.77 TRINITY_DN1611_c0_g1_i1:98-1180(-)
MEFSRDDEHWDQFKENEVKHNVHTTYDERLYTTTLVKENLPRELLERGARVAKEIESEQSENFHVRMDRGQVTHEELADEEGKFSAVLGTGAYKKNSHKIQRREQKAKDKARVNADFPTEVVTYVNSKMNKNNIEMTHSIGKDLGLTEQKPEAKAKEKVPQPAESTPKETETKNEADQNAVKKPGNQANLSVNAKEFKPKSKQGILNTEAKDFVPKTSAKTEAKSSSPLKTQAKEFKPSRLATKEHSSLIIKPLEEIFILGFKKMCKQVYRKSLITPAAKDNWQISSDIVIKQVKPQPANTISQQPYMYEGYYVPYPMAQQYFVPNHYSGQYSVAQMGSYPMINPRMPAPPAGAIYQSKR